MSKLIIRDNTLIRNLKAQNYAVINTSSLSSLIIMNNATFTKNQAISKTGAATISMTNIGQAEI